MSLERVEITQEVLLTCMTHAFTTEGEEIMGLLLGDIVEEPSGLVVSHIWMAYPQIRTDRRKDRVETSPEQMARCSAHAERLSRETGQRTRVVGWYHSHPHITVLPSHIDVRTQAMYQMLDPGFVGLIFSVFNSDSGASKAGHVQITAFQSVPGGHPLAAHGGGPPGLDGGQLESYSSEALMGLDTPTKEAIRLSAEAMNHQSTSSMVRREVPLRVAHAHSAAESSLHDLVVVQRILALEEKEAYKQATRSLTTSTQPAAAGSPDGASAGAAGPLGRGMSPGLALAQLHASGAYMQGLAQMLDTTVAASLVGLRSLAGQQALQLNQLAARNTALKEHLANRQKQLQQQSPAAAEPGSHPAYPHLRTMPTSSSIATVSTSSQDGYRSSPTAQPRSPHTPGASPLQPQQLQPQHQQQQVQQAQQQQWQQQQQQPLQQQQWQQQYGVGSAPFPTLQQQQQQLQQQQYGMPTAQGPEHAYSAAAWAAQGQPPMPMQQQPMQPQHHLAGHADYGGYPGMQAAGAAPQGVYPEQAAPPTQGMRQMNLVGLPAIASAEERAAALGGFNASGMQQQGHQ